MFRLYYIAGFYRLLSFLGQKMSGTSSVPTAPSSRGWGCPIPCAWEHLAIGKKTCGWNGRNQKDTATLPFAFFLEATFTFQNCPFLGGCYIIQNEDCVNKAIYWDTMEDRDAASGDQFFIDVWVVSSVDIHGLTEVVGHHWECQ